MSHKNKATIKLTAIEKTAQEDFARRDRALHQHEAAQDALRATRRSAEDELDTLFDLSTDPRADFMVMHERPSGVTRHSHPLRASFAAHLDRIASYDRVEDTTPTRALIDLARHRDTLTDARHRLVREYPHLAIVVENCCFGGKTEREMAYSLSLSRSAVSKRKWLGLRKLRGMCADGEEARIS